MRSRRPDRTVGVSLPFLVLDENPVPPSNLLHDLQTPASEPSSVRLLKMNISNGHFDSHYKHRIERPLEAFTMTPPLSGKAGRQTYFPQRLGPTSRTIRLSLFHPWVRMIAGTTTSGLSQLHPQRPNVLRSTLGNSVSYRGSRRPPLCPNYFMFVRRAPAPERWSSEGSMKCRFQPQSRNTSLALGSATESATSEEISLEAVGSHVGTEEESEKGMLALPPMH